MTKGRVVLVPFPFDDLTASKVRPAVCLTEPIGWHRHIVMAFISSPIVTTPTTTDVVLDPRRTDFAATGVRVASVLRLANGSLEMQSNNGFMPVDNINLN